MLLVALLGVLLCAPIPARATDGDGGTGEVGLTTTGEVSLTNDSHGAPMFPLGHPLAPGHPWQACIRVTATATDPADTVTFGATDVSGKLANHLQLTVESGTGGRFGDCAGFGGTRFYRGTLAALGDSELDAVRPDWHPFAERSRTFRIIVEVDDADQAVGQSAGATFTWRLISPAPVPGGPGPIASAPSSPATAHPQQQTSPRPSGTSPPGRVRAETRVPIAGRPPGGSWLKHLRTQILHRLGLLSPVSAGIARTVRKILAQPEIAFGPLLVALLFLVTQHLIDGRDPKLMLAQRTERDLQATFAGYAHSDETE